jgi:hypothetical protein
MLTREWSLSSLGESTNTVVRIAPASDFRGHFAIQLPELVMTVPPREPIRSCLRPPIADAHNGSLSQSGFRRRHA